MSSDSASTRSHGTLPVSIIPINAKAYAGIIMKTERIGVMMRAMCSRAKDSDRRSDAEAKRAQKQQLSGHGDENKASE